MTKVCPDPYCDSVYHNCKKENTRCLNCNGRIMRINQSTFQKKFSLNYFQFDYQTRDYLRKPEGVQIGIFE